MLWLFLRRNKYYDEYFDGIVYAACVGLGFAGFENIFYLVGEEEWLSVGMVRAFVSVPGHLCFAVAMGYFYSRCKFGMRRSTWTYLAVWLVPLLAHWIFDALLMGASVVSDTMSLLFIIVFSFFLRFLYQRSMHHINEMEDM
jgi:RsiW-degrading membrane proteinase PrsW (M82 family)